MKKTTSSKQLDDMKSEYELDYNKAKPNRFATPREKDRVVVVLDPDISHVFKTSESVNKVLRALITAMPKSV